jgi:hypothetical protein
VSKIEDVLADGRAGARSVTGYGWITAGEEVDVSWSALTIPNPCGSVEFVVLTGVRKEPAPPPILGPGHATLIGDTPFEMWAFDRGTYGFLAVNDAIAGRYGCSAAQLRSMRILDLLPWKEVPRLVAMVTELGSAENRTGLWRHRRVDGTELEVEDDILATESLGRPVCLVLSRAAAGTVLGSSAGAGNQAGDDRVPVGPGVARVRSQAAIVRALADHIKHVARPEDGDGRGQQLADEMARLGDARRRGDGNKAT